MSDIAVKVEDLWKRYAIGHKKSSSFRESIGQWFTKSEADYFWALKELNFEIKRGEAVGIIGKNGAGKSTLLKVLSKITYPTKGRIEINGRVSSLLEVGTGFHPELSGRQNVYLNGTILGMTRREITAKFDEIVAFSGVEKFIDTPVKHYSSGMKVRLAFSVAAHLEPEILIIDEVLAVGDAEFQKKCLGKMEDVTGEGRTVLFVSHNMNAVRTLCADSILLESGTIIKRDLTTNIIDQYLTEKISFSNHIVNRHLQKGVTLKALSVDKVRYEYNETASFELVIDTDVVNKFNVLKLLIYDFTDVRVSVIDFRSEDLFRISSFKSELIVKGMFSMHPFLPGKYKVGLYIDSSNLNGNFLNLISFEVLTPNSDLIPFSNQVLGNFRLESNFKIS